VIAYEGGRAQETRSTFLEIANALGD